MAIDIGWVDIGMFAFLAVSIIVGLARGVVFELMSLAGWFVAYFAALCLVPVVLPWIHVGNPGAALNHVIAFACVFIVTLIVWGFVARLMRSLIRATPLSAFDRLLGAMFGVVRGLLILLIVALLVGVTPWSKSDAWRRSQAVAWLNLSVKEIRPFLPFQVIQTSQGGPYVRHRWRDLQEPGQSVDL